MSDGLNDTQLRSLVERLVSLHETRDDLASDIADLLKEGASNGYDKAAIKECVKILRMDADKRAKRAEYSDTLSVYLSALGLA
jgi:uncharacterized protein (UPF0335 family)